MTHHSVMTSSLRILNVKLTNLMIFRVILIITVRHIYLKMLSQLYSINVNPDARKPPRADTKHSPAVQRKQAKPASVFFD